MPNAFLALALLYLLLTVAKKPQPPARPLTDAKRAQLQARLAGGNKVAAVRRYREWAGAGLVAAAAAVEKLRE